MQVDPSHEAQLSAHGLVRSQARLTVRVRPQHFKDGHMALRCVATIRPPQSPAPPGAAPPGAAPTAAIAKAPQTRINGHQPLPRIAMEIDNREAKLLGNNSSRQQCTTMHTTMTFTIPSALRLLRTRPGLWYDCRGNQKTSERCRNDVDHYSVYFDKLVVPKSTF